MIDRTMVAYFVQECYCPPQRGQKTARRHGAVRRRARSARPELSRLSASLGELREEMLAEHPLLALVIRADIAAVEHVRLLGHALEGELADWLTVLDHERDVARANLERCTAAAGEAGGRVAEAGIEEAGVVRAQL